MKNKLIALSLLIIMVTSFSSCFTSRSKVGCPVNAESGKRFKA